MTTAELVLLQEASNEPSVYQQLRLLCIKVECAIRRIANAPCDDPDCCVNRTQVKLLTSTEEQQ